METFSNISRAPICAIRKYGASIILNICIRIPISHGAGPCKCRCSAGREKKLGRACERLILSFQYRSETAIQKFQDGLMQAHLNVFPDCVTR